MPEAQRAVVVLREFEGLKFREIAQVLEIPEGTAKSRMADALVELAASVPVIAALPVASDTTMSWRSRRRMALSAPSPGALRSARRA